MTQKTTINGKEVKKAKGKQKAGDIKTGIPVAVDVQAVLDTEDQTKRDAMGLTKCPHCGIDKRELDQCQTCKGKTDEKPPRIPGTGEDGEPVIMGASKHNRAIYDRLHMTPEARRLSVTEMDENDVPKKSAEKGGRPPIDRVKALRYLCEAFRLDSTDEEACAYAGVSTSWYYDEMKLKDEFSEEIARAKAYPFLVARGAVVGAMETGDNLTGMKYLERRDKKRYSPRVEVTGEEGENIKVDLMTEARKRAGKYSQPKKAKAHK